MRQMTEMSQQPKFISKNDRNVLQRKKNRTHAQTESGRLFFAMSKKQVHNKRNMDSTNSEQQHTVLHKFL